MFAPSGERFAKYLVVLHLMERVAAAALNQTPLDWASNEANILESISKGQSERVDLLCLPELCVTGYGCEDMFYAPWVQQRAVDSLFRIVEHTAGICVVLGLPLNYDNALHNVAAVVCDKKLLGFYAKRNLASTGVYYEYRWFKAWKEGFEGEINIIGQTYRIGDVLFDIAGERIGFEICEDAWVGHSRTGYSMAARGATIIVNPSASHFAFGKPEMRRKLVLEGSARFGCIYIYTNLLGNEAGRLIFDGDTYIANKGKLIACGPRLGFDRVVFTSCEVNSDASINIEPEKKEYEFLLTATLGLFDYMVKTRSPGYTLSLSGGADSSCCAVLVDAMVKRMSQFGDSQNQSSVFNAYNGKTISDLLNAAYQSTRNSGPETLSSAKELAQSLGVPLVGFDVDQMVESYKEELTAKTGYGLEWGKDDLTLQNIQSRGRSPLIWLWANVTGKLLLTTSNRSEASVGYSTMDGDSSGSLALLAGIDKPFLLKWLQWAEQELGYYGLAAVNKLQPTAELRPDEDNQTDEKDLMPYALLNEIERCFIFEKRSLEETIVYLSQHLNIALVELRPSVEKYYGMFARAQWKRERTAPSFHFDDYSLDPKSWYRFPILNGGLR